MGKLGAAKLGRGEADGAVQDKLQGLRGKSALPDRLIRLERSL